MIVLLHPKVLEYTDAKKKSEILSSCYFPQALSQLEFALTKETKSFGVAYKLYTVL